MPEQKKGKMIEGRNLSKIFKDFWGRPKIVALKDVDIVVAPGSIFGLLGPNGAGKSTLLKLILGHLYPSSGIINVLGKSPRDVDAKSRIGYMSERPAFYPTLTAVETLLFFARLLGLPTFEAKDRIRQLLKMVGLENASSRHVGEFSYGMKKRLALAQSLLNDPDLLLLDEPTAGLDPIGCREVKDLMIMLGRRGKTIVMTSHLLADVQDVCDTIMIIYAGQVQAQGPVNRLLEKKGEIVIRSAPQSPQTLSRIEEIIKLSAPDSFFKVETPTRTLEDYFLSVIAEADRAGGKSSGAQTGGGVAEYLSLLSPLPSATPGTASSSLPSLVAETRVAVPEPAPKIASESPMQETPVEKAVSELASKAGRRETPQDPEEEADANERENGVDDELLSSLTRKR